MTLIKQGYLVFPIFRKIQKHKSRSATKRVSLIVVQLQKSGTSYSSNIQPRRISSFAALHNLSRIGKLNTYMLFYLASTSASSAQRILILVRPTISVQSLLPQRSLYSTIPEKREVNFHIAGNPTESANWSTMVVKQSSIQSSNTRRE